MLYYVVIKVDNALFMVGKHGVNWPSCSTLTTTGNSTHKLLTEIQEPMAKRAISPWVTAALLHQLPDMVAPIPAKGSTKTRGNLGHLSTHSKHMLGNYGG